MFFVVFIPVFFSPFSIAITSAGKRITLWLFVRLFDLCLFGIRLFLLPLGVWEALWLVVVALPGLFSNLFSMK